MTPAERDNYTRSRVAGRKLAVEMFCLVQDEMTLLGPVGKQRFCEAVIEIANAAIDALNQPSPEIAADINQPMNDQQARKFGQQAIRFGVHENKRIDEVPLRYLLMLTEDDVFKKDLRRYLASPRIKAELEAM